MSGKRKPTTWEEVRADFNESLDRVKQGTTEDMHTYTTIEFVRTTLDNLIDMVKVVPVNDESLKIVTEMVAALFEVGGMARFLLIHSGAAKAIIVKAPVRH